MFKLPKQYFNESIRYIEYEDSNGWGDKVETLNIEVTGVRVQHNVSLDRKSGGVSDDSTALVYVHPSSSFTEFKKGATIISDEQTYTIKTISTYRQPLKQGMHHWRLELV